MDIRGGNINGASIIGNPPLYDFTTWTFTNANSTGRFGPVTANLRAIYNTTGNTWINNDEYFTSPAGIQYWTVPVTGTYTITAAGASGGINVGLGALVSGTTTFNRGEVIRIAVGQRGANVNSSYGSGGGASFVVRSPFNSNASIIAIAGGGGGRNSTGNTFPAGGNVAVTPGNIPGFTKATGGGGGGGSNANGGQNGAAGADQSTGGYPGGGGGFFGNGGGSSGGVVGGRSFVFGANGGPGYSGSESAGGFGGGGGGTGRGAGGGGYNGGGAGDAGMSSSGAGGGSYTLNLTSVSATGNTILGNGYVTITLVSAL